MSDNTFWVNPDGLAKSSEAFTVKAEQISSLAEQIGKLTAPSVVGEAAGSDAAGKQFLAAHLQQASALYDGLLSWAGAVGNTGSSVTSTAKMFGAAENNAGDAAGLLGQQLNADPGGSDPGSNGPSGTADAEPRVVVPQMPAKGVGPVQPRYVIPAVPASAPGDGSGSGAPGQQLNADPGASATPDVAQPREVIPQVPANGVGLIQPREVIPEVPESGA